MQKKRRIKAEEDVYDGELEPHDLVVDDAMARRTADLSHIWIKTMRTKWSGEQYTSGSTLTLVALFLFHYSREDTQE